MIETLFDDYLWNMISVRDNATKRKRKTFIMEFFWTCSALKKTGSIKSNAESGIGYSDILIKYQKTALARDELKYADDRNTGCCLR